MTDTDRIEKSAVLRAPRARVWRALTDAAEFGSWFGVKLQGRFAAGKSIAGKITHPGYEHLTFECTVESLEAERRFSFRWHPYAIDPKVDCSKEPTTLVEFRLEDEGGDTLLSVVESGVDRIPGRAAGARAAEEHRRLDRAARERAAPSRGLATWGWRTESARPGTGVIRSRADL